MAPNPPHLNRVTNGYEQCSSCTEVCTSSLSPSLSPNLAHSPSLFLAAAEDHHAEPKLADPAPADDNKKPSVLKKVTNKAKDGVRRLLKKSRSRNSHDLENDEEEEVGDEQQVAALPRSSSAGSKADPKDLQVPLDEIELLKRKEQAEKVSGDEADALPALPARVIGDEAPPGVLQAVPTSYNYKQQPEQQPVQQQPSSLQDGLQNHGSNTGGEISSGEAQHEDEAIESRRDVVHQPRSPESYDNQAEDQEVLNTRKSEDRDDQSHKNQEEPQSYDDASMALQQRLDSKDDVQVPQTLTNQEEPRSYDNQANSAGATLQEPQACMNQEEPRGYESQANSFGVAGQEPQSFTNEEEPRSYDNHQANSAGVTRQDDETPNYDMSREEPPNYDNLTKKKSVERDPSEGESRSFECKENDVSNQEERSYDNEEEARSYDNTRSQNPVNEEQGLRNEAVETGEKDAGEKLREEASANEQAPAAVPADQRTISEQERNPPDHNALEDSPKRELDKDVQGEGGSIANADYQAQNAEERKGTRDDLREDPEHLQIASGENVPHEAGDIKSGERDMKPLSSDARQSLHAHDGGEEEGKAGGGVAHETGEMERDEEAKPPLADARESFEGTEEDQVGSHEDRIESHEDRDLGGEDEKLPPPPLPTPTPPPPRV